MGLELLVGAAIGFVTNWYFSKRGEQRFNRGLDVLARMNEEKGWTRAIRDKAGRLTGLEFDTRATPGIHLDLRPEATVAARDHQSGVPPPPVE